MVSKKPFFIKSKYAPYKGRVCDKCLEEMVDVMYYNTNINSYTSKICHKCYDYWERSRREAAAKWVAIRDGAVAKEAGDA